MHPDVFISYSSLDSAIAFQICEFLESHYIKCWIAPRNITPGQSWSREIIKGLKESMLTIVIYSDASNASDHVANELSISDSNLHPIIPILLSKQQPIEDIRHYIEKRESISASDNFLSDLESLLTIVRRYILQSNRYRQISVITDFDAVVSVDGRREGTASADAPLAFSIPTGEYILSIATTDNEFEKRYNIMDVGDSIAITLNDIKKECGQEEIRAIMKFAPYDHMIGCYGFFNEGLMRVNKDVGEICDDIVFIDIQGNEILNLSKFDFSSDSRFSDGLVSVYIWDSDAPNRYGFCDINGSVVIDMIFDQASDFHEGLATVKINDRYGVIDKKSNYVIEPVLESPLYFISGLAVKKEGDKYGYVNTKQEFVVAPQYDRAYNFCNGLGIVELGDKSFYIDREGNFIERLGKHIDCRNFSHYGLAVVSDEDCDRLIDINGNVLAEFDSIKCSYYFYGFYVVNHKGLSGLIYPWGEICAAPEFIFLDEQFKNSMVKISKDGHKGFIKADGEVLLLPEDVVEVSDFIESLAKFTSKDGKVGLLDINFDIKCPAIYDDINGLGRNYKQVANNNLYGFINGSGNLAVPCIFDEVPYGFEKETLVHLGPHSFTIGIDGRYVRNFDIKCMEENSFYSDITVRRFAEEYNELIFQFHIEKYTSDVLELSLRIRKELANSGMLSPLETVNPDE